MVKKSTLNENYNVKKISQSHIIGRRRSSRIKDKIKQETIKFNILKNSHSPNIRQRHFSAIEKKEEVRSISHEIEEAKNISHEIEEAKNMSHVEEEEIRYILHDEEARNIQAALNRDMTTTLPGRENQIKELHKILLDCSKNKKSISIYVSGCPGSGKTVTLKLLLSRSDITQKFKKIFVNCMVIRNNKVYDEIVKNLERSNDDCNQIVTIEKVEKLILKGKKPVLLILDEIDVLNTKNSSILYSLFELSSKLPSGKFVLIGIGNTLNFVDKNLPFLRLQNVITFQFPSYSHNEIAEIVSQRIQSVNAKRILFPEPAIKLLAGKVASFGGDARAALGIASASIYHILENVPKGCVDQTFTVEPQTILAVTSSIYDTVQRFQNEKIPLSSSFHLDSIPLHQKLILCSLLLVLYKKICVPNQLNVQKIREMYKNVCKQKFIDILNLTDFNNTCSLIEMNGIFSLEKGKNNDKVILKWDQDEMMNALCKETFFGDILRSNL